MSMKTENTRTSNGRTSNGSSGGGGVGGANAPSSIKILNDECIVPAQPRKSLKPITNSTEVQIATPPKQINMTIAKKKSTAATKQKTMEHYTLHIQNVKGEKNTENDEHDVIDFIYTENSGGKTPNQQQRNADGEEPEELHIEDEDEEDDGDEEDDDAPAANASNARIDDVEHVCGKCYKAFRRFSGLKKHLDFCRFDSGYHLRKAQMLKNLDKIEKDAVIMENKDICFCCGESYDTFHLGHINCPDCPKSFKTQTSYERHIFITHSEDNKYPCTICNAKLRSENLLKLHVEQHQNRGKPFACKICGKDFTRAYHLKRHQKYSSCMASESDSMSCKVCNKVFFRLDNLRAHLKQHLGSHSAKKPEYMCPICKNCFYSLSTLNIHTRTHTGERPFDCDLCEKKFPSLVALKKHRRYHTGEKPYTCTVCSQSFAVKEVLNRHMKRHTGERPHKCDECGKSFIQATQLRSHAKTHVRPFKCTGCDEKFKTEKQMLRHAKCHNRRRSKGQWKCTKCKTRFEKKEDYDAHMANDVHDTTPKRATRRKERTDCAVCEKNFDSAKSLHFHILKVHEVDPEEVMNTKPATTTKRKSNSSSSTSTSTSTTTPSSKSSPLSNKTYKVEAASPEKSIQAHNNNDENHSEPVKKKVKFSTTPIELTPTSTTSINKNGGGLVVQEFIIDEMQPTMVKDAIVVNSSNSFTVIPLEEEDGEGEIIETATANILTVHQQQQSSSSSPEKKKGMKKSLAESLAAAIADSMDSEDDETADIIAALSEEDLKWKDNVGKLLDMLVDSTTLKKFGWPQTSEESVLCQVIENCGHDLTKDESANYKDCDYATRMREYVKLLFTVVIHNNSIKELLNNYPIDEVIEYMLGNGEDDEDEDDNEVDRKDIKADTEKI